MLQKGPCVAFSPILARFARGVSLFWRGVSACSNKDGVTGGIGGTGGRLSKKIKKENYLAKISLKIAQFQGSKTLAVPTFASCAKIAQFWGFSGTVTHQKLGCWCRNKNGFNLAIENFIVSTPRAV